jgi:hypothetical protein
LSAIHTGTSGTTLPARCFWNSVRHLAHRRGRRLPEEARFFAAARFPRLPAACVFAGGLRDFDDAGRFFVAVFADLFFAVAAASLFGVADFFCSPGLRALA